MSSLIQSKLPRLHRFIGRVKLRLAPFKKLSRWLRPGKLWGVPVRIHTSAALLAAALLLVRGPWGLGALVVGLILHEYAHVWMSKSLGMRTNRVEITGVGAAAVMGSYAFERVFNNGDIEMKVAAAGPLMSAVLAILGYIGATAALLLGLPSVAAVFAEFAFINTLLGCFNMLPLFPMDGGRVLRGFLHHNYFQHFEDKELLNRAMLASSMPLKGAAIGMMIGGLLGPMGPGPGIILYFTIKGLEGEVRFTKIYINHLKEKYNYIPDRMALRDVDWWIDLGLREKPPTFRLAKRAYRTRVQNVHPDKGGDARNMQTVVRAYELAKRSYGVS